MILILTLLLAGAETVYPGDEIERLEAHLAAHPEDVDARLKLAITLSHADRLDASRKEAERVLVKAPEYWDAHLLIARLDAWAADYDAARARLDRVIARAPGNRQARRQLAKVELWAGEPARTVSILEPLLEQERSADLLVELAQAELERRHTIAAYQRVTEALSLSPEEERAKKMKETIRLVRADLRVEVENMTGPHTGHGEVVAVTALPDNFVGFTIIEEFRRRFGTDNNRIGVTGFWRPAKPFTVTAHLAYGLPAEVVSMLTARATLSAEVYGPVDVSIGYTFDRFPTDLLLHRIRGDVGVRLLDTLSAVAAYTLGISTTADTGDTLHHGQAQLRWRPLPFLLSASYGFGRQIDRVVLTPGAPLTAYLVHEVRLSARYQVARWLRLGLAGGTDRRSNGTHLDHLALTASARF